MTLALPPALLAPAAFLLGSVVGSFLNVCIYRLPRDLSVRSPARSFCPHCQKTIPWWHNLPLLSWLWLRGRCASCQNPIPFRYFLVELLTATLFAAFALRLGNPDPSLLLPAFTLIGLLLSATFIDLEHLIIPDEITWGGTATGLLFSALLPALHKTQSPLDSLLASLLGAACGYGSLWAVVELGRLAFGRKRFNFPETVPARWTRCDQDADLLVGEERSLWSHFFFRGSEQLRMGVLSGTIDGSKIHPGEALWTLNALQLNGQTINLNSTDVIELQIHWLVIPREAMGFGDVKLLAAIGAFLGWKATLFTVVAACNLGLLAAIPTRILRRKNDPIPFGPYLAGGALLWMADGPGLWSRYLLWLSSLTHPGT